MRFPLSAVLFLSYLAAISQPVEKFSLAGGQTTPTWNMVHKVKFVPQSDLVCVLGDDNLVVWDFRKNVALKEFTADYAFSVNEKGDMIAFASKRGIEIWKVPEMVPLFVQPTLAQVRLIEFSRDSRLLFYNTCYGEEARCNVFHALNLTNFKSVFEKKLDFDSYACIESGGRIVVGGERSVTIMDFFGNVQKKIKDQSIQLVCRFVRLPNSQEVAFYSDLNLLPQYNNKSMAFSLDLIAGKFKMLGALPGLDAYPEAFLFNGSLETTRKFVDEREAMETRDPYDIQRNKFDFDPSREIYIELAGAGTILLLRSLRDHHVIKSVGWSGHSGGSVVGATGNILCHQFAGNLIVWDLVKLRPLYSVSVEGDEENTNFGIDSVGNKLLVRRKINEQLVLQTLELSTGRLLSSRPIQFKDALAIKEDGELLGRRDNQISFGPPDIPAVPFYTEKGIYDHIGLVIWVTEREGVAVVNNLMEGKQEIPILLIDAVKGSVTTLHKTSVEFLTSLKSSPDRKQIGWIEDLKTITLFDRPTGKKVFTKAFDDPAGIAFAFGNNNELFIYSNGTLSAFNTLTAAQRWTMRLPEGATSLHYARNIKRLIACTPSGSIHVIDIKDESHHIVLNAVNERSYCVNTPEGFYKASPGMKRGISIRHDDKLLTGEATNLYERPDKVMEASGFSDSWIRDLYKRMYDSRSVTTESLNLSTNLNQFPFETTEPVMVLDVNCTGPATTLHVVINGVPAYGEGGLPINSSSVKSNLNLYPGVNRIKCFCRSSTGGSSNLDLTEIVLNQTAPEGKIYFAGFAVSRFRDSKMNLQYPVKDVKDLVSVLRRVSVLAGRSFEADTLFESNVTEASLVRLKKKIKSLKQQDIVILHYSGHGMLDEQRNFYLSTSGTDFTDPARSSLDYRHFENLLDSVAPQHRLILLDACHSGAEQDKLTQKNLSAGAKGMGYDVVDVFQASVEEYYSMSMSNSGNFVLAATSRAGKAYELDSLKNGLFTKAIMEGLRSTVTDANGDRQISVGELRHYVESYVLQFSKGVQKPSTRNENINIDFIIRNLGNR